MKELIARIDELYAKATPGERVCKDDGTLCIPFDGTMYCHVPRPGFPPTPDDNRLSTALHNAWPQIRDALEAWIPVSERLPERTDVVLVWEKRGAHEIVDGDVVHYKRDYFTHWQPLPAPPIDSARKGER